MIYGFAAHFGQIAPGVLHFLFFRLFGSHLWLQFVKAMNRHMASRGDGKLRRRGAARSH